MITGIATDTRTLVPGEVFFALAGRQRDGHEFIPDAFVRRCTGCRRAKSVSR